MNHTDPVEWDRTPTGAYVVAALIMAFCVLSLFLLALKYCKCTCFHCIWLRLCPDDYTRVDLQELAQNE